MSPSTNQDSYYASRAEAERRRAAEAADERARRVHEQLAEEYAARAATGIANDDSRPSAS